MKKLKNYGLASMSRYYGGLISNPWNPRVWHRDITKDDEHENIDKKVDIFHNLNGILA